MFFRRRGAVFSFQHGRPRLRSSKTPPKVQHILIIFKSEQHSALPKKQEPATNASSAKEPQFLGIQQNINSWRKVVIFSVSKTEVKSALKIILYYKNHQISTAQNA